MICSKSLCVCICITGLRYPVEKKMNLCLGAGGEVMLYYEIDLAYQS